MKTERITLSPTLRLELRGDSLVAIWRDMSVPIKLTVLNRWVLRQLREAIK